MSQTTMSGRRSDLPPAESAQWADWVPPVPTGNPSRAVVLGGGGATGIAWMGGLFAGLRDLGVDVHEADTMIGTSAGSVVGAHLRLGIADEVAMAKMEQGTPLADLGHITLGVAWGFVASRYSPDAARGRARVGRAAVSARTQDEEAWISVVADGLADREWPAERLLVTAVDCETGKSVVFHRESGVPLNRAVAASCTVPGIFPPVTIGGRRYIDGGVRSPANVDLAVGHDRVLVVAPLPIGVSRAELPATQTRRLRDRSRTLMIVPDRHARRVMGVNVLDMRRAPASVGAGREQAERVFERVQRLWND